MQDSDQKLPEHLFEQIITMLKDEFGDDLLGILVTGSHIHGTPGPTSDLDVHVLIKSPRRRRRNIILDGLEIEMFCNPPFQIRRYFAEEENSDQHMFSFGRAIYDPLGVVAELQAEAQALWEAGPPPIKKHEEWTRRYGPADLLRDLEDVGNADEATSNLLITRIVESLLASHYRINHHWLEKAKRRLADLERWDPTAAHLARTALEHGPLAERRATLERLATHVLAPLGGIMPLEWATEWEEVQT